LGEVPVGFKPARSAAREAVAWLPAQGGEAVASSALIAERPQSQARIELAPWTVTGLPLSNSEAVDLLCGCAGKRTLAPGLVGGEDLAFWIDALRFAGAIVARQDYLPNLAVEAGRYCARWEPVIEAADADRLAQLAKRMPKAARALTSTGEASAPETPPTAALRQFIFATVDHLVRSKAGESRSTGRAKPSFASAHDAWFHALRSPDAAVEGDPKALAQLQAQVAEWRRPIALSAASPTRLCFRLEEPAAVAMADEDAVVVPTGEWQVRYLLQSREDPSLLVPVADAWRSKGSQAAVLKRFDARAREHLLSSLGQAAGLSPRVATSLRSAQPAGFALDATGAHQFLTETAAVFEQAGFGVMLPAWWTRKGTKVRLAAGAHVVSPKMKGKAGLSLETIVKFNWRVAIGDQPLTLAELEALARMKAPLVRLRGQWVEVDAEEIRAAIDLLTRRSAGAATVREIVQMALGAKEVPGKIPLESVDATGWVADLLAQLQGRSKFTELPAPDGFDGALRPYQQRGYSWLAFLRQWGLGACLADDMGLGKTIQTLALLQRDWRANGKRPVLLICPTSVVGNWQKEAARFTPELPVMIHHGLTRAKGAAFKDEAARHAIVVSSYALLHRDFEILKDVDWFGVVLDEAQNIKNPETKQSKAARALKADYRVVLTGTPVENHIGDLWSIMEFLNPGFLGHQAEFRRRFFLPIQAYHDPEAANRLKRLTGPFILRRLKTDREIISDLPEKMEMKVFCNLTREQASLYEAVVKEVQTPLDSAEGIRRKGMVLAAISKLKQVCNHPAHFLGDNSATPGRSGKLARLTEMLEEVFEVGDRALIFTQFTEMGAIIQRHLQEAFGREVLFLHGGVPKPRRDRMVERFQSGGDGPNVFLLSLKAGGTGLNLTRANHVFHYDRWWNPAVENQATDRVFRIGQTRNVQVHKFLCVGTLEEKIDEMMERKRELAEQVIGAGEGWLTELSTAQLRNLFALRREAVA
jgi:SNF2 family DNA or RNA helicase